MFKWLVGRRKREKKSEDSAEDEPDATQLEVKKDKVKSEDTGKPRKTTRRIKGKHDSDTQSDETDEDTSKLRKTKT